MTIINGQEVNEEVLDEMERTKWVRTWKTFLKDWRLYTLLVPLLVFMLLFKYLPMKGILMAFKYYDSSIDPLEMDWQGYVYAKALFNDTTFWTAFRNTFVNSMYGLVFGFPIPILLALMFSEIGSNGYRSVLQVCSYLPKFMSTVVITTVITVWCNNFTRDGKTVQGILTKLYLNLGWMTYDEKILYTVRFFRPLYQVSGVWEGAGYGSIVYFAAVLAISPTSYEAARMDGANKLQQIN